MRWSDIKDAVFPAAGSARAIINSGSGKLEAYGTEKPANGVAGYAKGSTFKDTDAGKVYVNEGTNTSCLFKEIGTIAAVGTASGIGPSPLIWDDVSMLDAILNPQDYIYFFDDFLGPIDVTTADGWVLTQVDTKGSIAPDATIQGGVLTVTSATGDSADDGINAQLTNCLFKPAAGVTIRFEARIKVSDATQQWYVGLAGIDTTLIAAGIADDVVDKAGFYHMAASTDNKVSTIVSRTSVQDETADVAGMTDNTFVKVGFVIEGLTSIKFYVNGVLVETGVTANTLPNAVMCLSFVAQYESADEVLSVDWVRILQEGGRI